MARSCAVAVLARGDSGVIAAKPITRGEVVARGDGVVAECGAGNAFPLYGVLEQLAASQGAPETGLGCVAVRLMARWRTSWRTGALGEGGHAGDEALRELLSRFGDPISLHEMSKLVVRFERNAFAEGAFRLVTKFNHSCRPNCLAHFDTQAGQMVIITTEDIPQGSELSINYISERQWHLPTDQRILQKRPALVHVPVRLPRSEYNVEGTENAVAVAEVDLETMRCPDCADGYCRPLEDHSTRGVTVDGWSACSACKTMPLSETRQRARGSLQQMMQVEALANLVENASHQGSLAPAADFYEV